MTSLDARLRVLAAEQGDRAAVIAVDLDRRESAYTWRELDAETGKMAQRLRESEQPVVAVPAESTLAGVVALLAALRAGLLTAPLDHQAPGPDRARHLAALRAAVGPVPLLDDVLGGSGGEPAAAKDGGYVLLTGGSTGNPKPILRPGVPAGDGPSLLLRHTGWVAGQVQLVVGPLHHAAPFTHFLDGVLSGNTLVLSSVYYPELMLDLIEQYGVEWLQLTPAHMRMADRLLPKRLAALKTVRGVLHTAAPCPPDTKRAWIDAVGPERLHELYAATEGIGVTLCSGTEWLAHPGTVGRGFVTRIRIYDDAGRRLGPGEIGEVHMRSLIRRKGPVQLGAGYGGRDGFRSVGDHGRLDEEGYLYLSGRRDDLVIIGGENVYTDDVTQVVLAHPAVADAAVAGVTDDVFGAALTAYVVPRPETGLTVSDVLGHCRAHLAPYKVPRTARLVPELPRSAAGKLLRARLQELA